MQTKSQSAATIDTSLTGRTAAFWPQFGSRSESHDHTPRVKRVAPPLPNSMRAPTEASAWHSIPDNHLVRIPCSLEITDSIPPQRPRPVHVAAQIAADIIVSGQVRMNIWELLCDCLPAGDLRREASTECVSGVSFCSGVYSRLYSHGQCC